MTTSAITTLFADKKSALQAQDTRQEHGSTSYLQDEYQPTCEVVSPTECLSKEKQYTLNDFFKNKAIHTTVKGQDSKEIVIQASAFIKSVY